MVTCFVLAGQIVLSLSAPMLVREKDGSEVEHAVRETIIFPQGVGVNIVPGPEGWAKFEIFQDGKKLGNPQIDPFGLVAYEEVADALSDCRTD